MSHLWGKWVSAIIAVVFCIAVGVSWFAPQLPTLLEEGFPSPVWPPNGSTLLVRGVVDDSHERLAELPDAVMGSFVQSRGRALVIASHAEGLVEHYAQDMDRDTRLNSYSLVKSLIGAMVLRALADQRISSLDDGLQTYLGPSVPDVTVKSVLTMTAGLSLSGEPPKTDAQKPLDDHEFSPFSPVGRLHAMGIEAILPGLGPDPALAGSFHYQSANTALLGLLLERVYGRPLPEVLSDLIWEPAGANDAYWRSNPETGRASAYCCLYARPRDWARVGLFLLDNGTAEAPFLPDALWRAFVLPDVPPEERRAGVYGLHIRHDVLDRPGEVLNGPFAYMMGHAGQVVYLLPTQGRVVVRFGAQPQLLHTTLYEIFPD